MASPKGDSAAMFVESQSHGGLVALMGGPAHGRWFFADWYAAQDPECWRRAGYVETRETVENPVAELRGYGMGTVWRHDGSPPVEVRAETVEPLPDVRCPCGERLLLIRPGRIRCERCRLEAERQGCAA